MEKGMCDFCNYENVEVEEYDTTLTEGKRTLCNICAGTPAGNALEYPNQYPNSAVMKQLSFIGNMILEKLDKIGIK